jgi:hypothetical protein
MGIPVTDTFKKKTYTADAWRITWSIVGGSRRIKFFRSSTDAVAFKEKLNNAVLLLSVSFQTKPEIEKVEFE